VLDAIGPGALLLLETVWKLPSYGNVTCQGAFLRGPHGIWEAPDRSRIEGVYGHQWCRAGAPIYNGAEDRMPANRHHVTVTINEHVEPIDRFERYEDPLTNTLGERGEVSGGGSMLNAEREIVFVDIELELADLDGSLDMVRHKLNEIGVPKGSRLVIEGRPDEPIGAIETLTVYLDGVGLPHEVYAALDFPAFYGALDMVARAEGGGARSVWGGPTETGVHLAARDAEALRDKLVALWNEHPILQNARLVVRRSIDGRAETRLPRR
jgi:hypothetical protein